MVDPLKRPDRLGQAKPNAATQRPDSTKQKKVITTGNRSGSGNGQGGSRGGNSHGENRSPEGQPEETSPWLIQLEYAPDPTASFVEYLRWMRSPDGPYENSAKVQIMQMAIQTEETRTYEKRLQELTDRTRKIAQARKGLILRAECPWRVRVGGHRGPNKGTLLPAFDATGMPYIPSSTLRGVARTQAILEKLPPNLDRLDKKSFEQAWKQADLEVAEWFGHLKAQKKSDYAGKVIFLDAYPLPEYSGQLGGLAMDMANQVWNWDSTNASLKYKPNPNPFFSLKNAVFQIGLCPLSNSEEDQAACEQVKEWLIAGLQRGVGSQINTGYGRLIAENTQPDDSEVFLQLKFHLKGQLIHGHHEFSNLRLPYALNSSGNAWKKTRKVDGSEVYEAKLIADPEVRPIAFKSMLRYWFRALSLGVLPMRIVQEEWEPILFGAIQPQTRGWVEFQVTNTLNPSTKVQQKGEPCLEQSGLLKLSYSLAAPVTQERRTLIQELFEHLTWLMFHLGGVGQGARRPLYCRKNRPPFRPPWYRGTELRADRSELIQELPATIENFCQIFETHLQQFYELLYQLTGQNINFPRISPNRPIRRGPWQDILDANCEIVVCSGKGNNGKPYALAILHNDDLKIPKMRNGGKVFENGKEVLEYNPELCGKTGDRSPVWITSLGNYQVVTVFGATQDPRKKYLETLKKDADEYQQVFPLA
jgi:CRISPR-associated protein Cmr6